MPRIDAEKNFHRIKSKVSQSFYPCAWGLKDKGIGSPLIPRNF